MWAQPFGYSVNSRGNLTDDQRVNALYRINLSTGQTEYIGWTGFIDIEGLAFSSDGTLYGASDEDNTLVLISTETGSASAINNQRTNIGIPLGEVLDFGLSFTCSGDLLMVSDRRSTLYRVDAIADPDNDLSVKRIGEEGQLNAPITAIAAWGDKLFGLGQGLDANDQIDSPNLYRINAETGGSELIGPLGAQASPYANAGLAFDEDGTLWAVTDRLVGADINMTSEILQIDPKTGTATKITEADIVGFESLAIGPPMGCDRGTTPEPAPIPTLNAFSLSLLVLLLGLVAMTAIRQKRS